MNQHARLIIIVLSFALLTGFGPFRQKPSKEKQQQDIHEMSAQVLDQLYQEAPQARDRIANSAGYAVFSNIGINVLLISTANGHGLAHNNQTGKDTYMKMFSAGVGVGYGVKDFRAVFVFENIGAFNEFIESGWTANAQTDAAAVSGDKGDAVDFEIAIAPGVKIYQMTETGLALQATLQGTKYMPDEDLN